MTCFYFVDSPFVTVFINKSNGVTLWTSKQSIISFCCSSKWTCTCKSRFSASLAIDWMESVEAARIECTTTPNLFPLVASKCVPISSFDSYKKKSFKNIYLITLKNIINKKVRREENIGRWLNIDLWLKQRRNIKCKKILNF